MSTVPVHKFKPTEYLAIERQAATKSEYYRGEMFAMSGASRQHVRISTSIVSLLWSQLRDRPCEVYNSDMRVKVSFSGVYTYPDASVACGNPEFDDGNFDTFVNPLIVVEVLSPSTEGHDRGKKFELYRQLPSLREYVVVAQDRVFVEHYVRQDDDAWRLTDHSDLAQTIVLPSINCRLALADVYDKVDFEPAAENSNL